MKKLSLRKSPVLLAVAAINVLLGVLGNMVSKHFDDSLGVVGLSQYRGLITVGLLFAGLLIAAWVFRAERRAQQHEGLSDTSSESESAERELLADLAARYQERNLHKLDGRYEISLVVSDDSPGTSPKHFYEELDDHDGEATRYIINQFERKGRLLIVGNPGSGKTVLLVALAQYLAGKAGADTSHPLPVILNLDSWSSDYTHFGDWAKAMLTKGYGLSLEFAGQLLAEQRLVFLLDGLDELANDEEPNHAAQVRAECLTALDKSLHDGTMSAVICCRHKQYEQMLHRTGGEPLVAAVVRVQDLTPWQIERALIKASETPRDRFAAPHLRAALARNGVYGQVLATPFYFTTALQVFDSTKPPFIDAPDKETLEANLIAAFMEKKLQVTPNARGFSVVQTHAWLTRLAQILENRRRVAFELADLQPSLLRRTWQYRLVYSLIFAVGGSLVLNTFLRVGDTLGFALLLIPIGNYMISEEFGQFIFEPLRHWRPWNRILWIAVAAGLASGAILAGWMMSKGGPSGMAPAEAFQLVLSEMVVIPTGALIGLVYGLFVHMVIRLIVGVLGKVPAGQIVTEDFPRWSLSPLWRGQTWRNILREEMATGFTAGTAGSGWLVLVMGILVLVGQTDAFRDGKLSGLLLCAVLFPLFIVVGALAAGALGFIVALPLGLFRACRQVSRFAKIRYPYQRLRAGIIFNIFQFVVVAVMLLPVIFLFLLSVGKSVPFRPGMFILALALLGFFRTPIFKHSVLHLCLASEGAVPLRCAAFLSYATDLRILERDGGQWRFRHQILQEYFAARAIDHVPADKT